MKILSLASASLSFFLAAACSPGEMDMDAGPTEDELNVEACEHMADGPFNEIAASADGMNLASMSAGHTTHRITTADIGDGNKGGSVEFESVMEMNHTFWLNHHFDMKFIAADDSEAMLVKSVHEVTECDEVAMFHTFMLSVGTYTVEVGPTQMDVLDITWEHGEPAGEDGDMEHMHDGGM